MFVKLYCKSWKIVPCYFWLEYYLSFDVVSNYTEFQFFLKWYDTEASVLHREALSDAHYASVALHTLKIYQSLIVSRLEKMPSMMIFGISKIVFFFSKTVHVRVKKDIFRYKPAGIIKKDINTENVSKNYTWKRKIT